MRRVEELISTIEATADMQTRERVVELVRCLMEFHGAGVERMMEIVHESAESGRHAFDGFAADPLVGSLLLLYGLHPLDFETRVRAALERVRPYLASHGGGVELLDVSDGVVRLRMQGSDNGCPSSAIKLKLAVEEAIYDAAPDALSLELEGVAETKGPPSLVQLEGLRRGGGAA